MKRYGNLWDKFISKDNFILAAKLAAKHKSKQKQVRKYMEDFEGNTEKIRQLVISGKFHTSEYRRFYLYEPKKREVFVLPFMPDRVVHHAVMNILKPIMVQKFITHTYSCIDGRGIHGASQQCSKIARRCTHVFQGDCRKFFPNMLQFITLLEISWLIKDKRLLAIIADIIYSYDDIRNCPLGNHTSQWFGNWYLHRFDNYVIHALKCKNYVRYCDDFILGSNSLDELHDWQQKAAAFLHNEYGINLSYSEVIPVRQGIDFVGYRHYGKYVRLRRSTFRRQLHSVKTGIDSQGWASILGHDRHCCSYKIQHILEDHKHELVHLESRRNRRLREQH